MFRQKIKEFTFDSHKNLEGQYPFSRLTYSEEFEITAHDSLMIFKSFFAELATSESVDEYFKFIADKLACYTFDAQLSDSLNKQSFSVCRCDILESMIALKYVYLGSQFGNRIIYNSNPAVRESKYAEYFALPANVELFNSLMNEVEFKDEEFQTKVLSSAKTIFDQLIISGTFIEKLRGRRVRTSQAR